MLALIYIDIDRISEPTQTPQAARIWPPMMGCIKRGSGQVGYV